MAKGLSGIDNAAASKGKGVETLWQFVKFIFVSLGAFVIQTCLPYLIKLPMSEELLNRPYDILNLGIFSSEKVLMATGKPTGLGLFIALTAANIIAQIVSFFVNKEKTFNSGANTKVVLPIYIVFTLALIAFTAWLQPFLVAFLNSKGLNSSAIFLSAAICGAIQFFLYFPVDKILFRKKKEEVAEAADTVEEAVESADEAVAVIEEKADAAEESVADAAQSIEKSVDAAEASVADTVDEAKDAEIAVESAAEEVIDVTDAE